MKRYVIATIKSWNIRNAEFLIKKYSDADIRLVTKKEELTESLIDEFDPEYIFFPHWSWIIPKNIYEKYECIVFHMTDLPFGRGGSPLQNLIVRGIYNTKVSAIKVSADVDAGAVYFKEPIDISHGNADEILTNVSEIIFEKMIPRFIIEVPVAAPQTGKVVKFKRRTPEESEIPVGLSQRQIYDYIRMLDGEGYPPAFIRCGNGKVIFSDAKMNSGVVSAKAKFVEVEN